MTISQAISQLNWNRSPEGLYAPIAYTLESGGKRLRPQLVLIGARLFGGNDEEAMHAALAIEIFHNFTLLHDDVMDCADVRRGKPTVHRKWNQNTAILSGDQMLIEAYKELSLVPERVLGQVMDIFNKMATQICEGQQYDMDFETQETVSLDEYIRMIHLKTSVLLGAALQIGACIAGAGKEQQEMVYALGVQLGLAFQIQDDILDVYGQAEDFGKAIGGDILCGKKTYLLLSALQLADAETREELMGYLHSNMESTTKIQAVTNIYNRLHIKDIATQIVEQYTQSALSGLQVLPKNEANEQLHQLAMQLIHRNK